MKILMIGGTGVISTEVFQKNSGGGTRIDASQPRYADARPVSGGSKSYHGEYPGCRGTSRALRGRYFDVIVDWISYTPAQLEQNLRVLRGMFGQFVFISSTAVYTRGLRNADEEAPKNNMAWDYARDKVGCEEYLKIEDILYGCNWTVVRPAVTYGDTRIPCAIIPNRQWTLADRMLRGKPIVMHDDGSAMTAVMTRF